MKMRNKTKSLIGDGQNYVETLVHTNTPHKITYTNNSLSVELTDGREFIFTDKFLTMQDLSFIGSTKKDVILNAERLRIPERKPVFYHIYPAKFGNYGELVEIDISSAFWDTAYKEGIISDRTFIRGESVAKDVRLIAFGSAAAVRRSFVFDGEKYSESMEESSVWGRRAYFYVASKITALMRSICDDIPGKAYLFWVDAIICSSEYKDFICKRIFSENFAMKAKHLLDCKHFSESGALVWEVTEKETGRVKRFKEFERKNPGISYIINRNQ